MGEKKRPYIIIDLADYSKNVGDFTFDWGNWNNAGYRFKSLEEAENSYIPDYKLPKNFTDEEKLDCINYAYDDADSQAGMTAYVDKFHEYLLDKVNEVENRLKFEYEEDDWESIKFRVYYGIEFITGEVEIDGDTYEDVNDYIRSVVDFNECISSAKHNLERFDGRCEETFKDVYMDRIRERIDNIKREKGQLYQKVKHNLMNNKISEKKKVMCFIKMIQKGG
jgi:hypothetical protein